jgi:hypothetical protein
MNIDWNDIETTKEELDSFNEYYRYVESLIAEKEGLIYGKFSECFEYSFSRIKNGMNFVSYFQTGKKGRRKKSDIKTIEVIPFDIWKIRENRNKLLDILGI